MTKQSNIVRDRSGAIDFKHYDRIARQQRAFQWRAAIRYLSLGFVFLGKRRVVSQSDSVIEMQCRDC